MSAGANDIFSIMAHSVSDNFVKELHHLGILKVDESNGNGLAKTLKICLEKHNFVSKVFSYVFDGESSVSKCASTLKSSTSCASLRISFPFKTTAGLMYST